MLIRRALQTDIDAILSLMREFAAYEKLLDHFEATSDRLSDVMFGDTSFVHGLIAEEDEATIGYAVFYPNFATFRGQRGLYLEDIYISPNFQGRGVGEAMLRKVAAIAREMGCERIDFQVLEWNVSAIEFYEKLGAQRDDTERHFKFTDKAFQDLVS